MLDKFMTEDGSESFYNDKVDDIYHSTSGAVEEAMEKYAKPSGAKELAAKGSVAILDVCFGLGYNSAAAIDLILESNPGCKIRIIGLEQDQEIISKIAEVTPKFRCFDMIKRAAAAGHLKEKDIEISIIMGDARNTVNQLKDKFDIVFFDPFSPKKCPELWTAEFFSDIYKTMKKGAILTTYSCAGFVRKNLISAGFIVKDGPSVSRRAPSTIAIKERYP